MIKPLTEKELELAKKVKDEWLDLFLSLKFDEELCKKLIKKLYGLVKLPEPEIYFYDSVNQIINDKKIRSTICILYDETWLDIQTEALTLLDTIQAGVERKGTPIVKSPFFIELENDWREFNTITDIDIWHPFGRLTNKAVGAAVIVKDISEQPVSMLLSPQASARFLPLIAKFDFWNRLGYHDNEEFLELKELYKCNIFASFMCREKCFVSRPPVFINVNDEGNLHSISDYALYFKDGFGAYFVHGVKFSKYDFNRLVKNKNVSGEEIMKVKNAEQKAALIKVHGYERVLNDLDNLKIVNKETVKGIDGKKKEHILYEFDFEGIKSRVLSLDDHSTGKKYFLGVPADCGDTVRDALAWTFKLEKDYKYKPIIQS
jgi:hypothetical protein